MTRIRKILIGLGIIGASAAIGIALLDRPMTYDEYIAYISVLNYEIQKSGGSLTIEPAGKSPIEAMEDRVLQRTIDESEIIIDGERMTPNEYRTLRSTLINKRR
ncbi:hypothetical protein HY492_00075 [Candidatus Woesearchaeota archaeon]|nr:hypothetical protein [Candidatus Woesearchaeota archaeon]